MDHAHYHFNVQPGEYGAPMLHLDFSNVILDALHMAELNFTHAQICSGIPSLFVK